MRRDANPSQAARDDVRRPCRAALRVAFPAPPGRRERLPMASHRPPVPSFRGSGEGDRIMHISPGQGTRRRRRRGANHHKPSPTTILDQMRPVPGGYGEIRPFSRLSSSNMLGMSFVLTSKTERISHIPGPASEWSTGPIPLPAPAGRRHGRAGPLGRAPPSPGPWPRPSIPPPHRRQPRRGRPGPPARP